jgi:hypothetical protein
MKDQMKASNCWAIKSVYLGFAVCIILVGGGCASTHKTTTTETTTEYPHTAQVGAGERSNRAAVDKSETTTAVTETKSGHPGLLSSTVHAIGWVISLPFRLVGGLIGWIF